MAGTSAIAIGDLAAGSSAKKMGVAARAAIAIGDREIGSTAKKIGIAGMAAKTIGHLNMGRIARHIGVAGRPAKTNGGLKGNHGTRRTILVPGPGLQHGRMIGGASGIRAGMTATAAHGTRSGIKLQRWQGGTKGMESGAGTHAARCLAAARVGQDGPSATGAEARHRHQQLDAGGAAVVQHRRLPQ